MNLLVFDTSTERAVMALETASSGSHACATEADRRHGRDLIPELRTLLERAELTVADVQLIGVGLGPGSYTGLRVGLMAAKTLAYVSGAALVGLDSLEVIARNAPVDALRVSVVGDAQRGDVYTASFERAAAGAALSRTRDTMIEPLLAWAERLNAGEVLMGPGLNVARIRAVVPAGVVVRDVGMNAPTAGRLVECARDAWASGRRDDFWTLEPLYLRRSSAEEQWDKRALADAEGGRASHVGGELALDALTQVPGSS